MLEGKELILATKPFAKEIRWKSWLYTLSTLAIVFLLYAGVIFLKPIALRIVCCIFTGLVLVRLFVIYHDHQHHSILNKSKAADMLFTLFGLFILVPTSIWRRSHDYHHSHNSKLSSASIGSYPIYTLEKYKSAPRSEQLTYLFIRHPLTILFGYVFVFFYGMNIQPFIVSPARHWDALVSAILHIVFSVLVFVYFGWLAWLLCIVIPFMIAGCMGAYLFYAQHNFPGVEFRRDIEWCYEHAALESSSYMKMNFFWSWITANIGYHHIHHINARIPFYRLPEIMEAMPELQSAKITSLSPREIIACLRLKVWDPKLNKMVGV